MPRRRVKLHHRRQRPVLSDTLPFEVPVSFSNRHFYNLLVEYGVGVVDGRVCWESSDARFDEFIYLITGVARTEPVTTSQSVVSGKLRHRRSLLLVANSLIKTPFQFDICHRTTEARTLTVPHPLSQIAVAGFYNEHAATIVYYAGRSPYSIRRPESIARYSNFKDRTHAALNDGQQSTVEESDREYSQIGSFFVYRSVSNVFRFFESYKYHRAEKRFNAMAQIDISKCFDSIYTHSLPWAINGKSAVKDNISHSKGTFGGAFDALMQNLNQNETNGIVIGPEFSRVFAELILQDVDDKVEKTLRQDHRLMHRRDYEIFRYVDDYFVFYNDDLDLSVITETLRHHLLSAKLHINAAKTKIYSKPVITEITIAKNGVSDLIDDLIQSECVEVDTAPDSPVSVPNQPNFRFKFSLRSRELIVRYKAVLKLSGTTYLEVGNFTFALLERRLESVLKNYTKSIKDDRGERSLVMGLTSFIEFCFFLYAGAPRVNLSIRLTRIITTISNYFRNQRLSSELKHHFFKYVHDNVVHQLRKNECLPYKEVETLYLLTSLGELGKEYWLEEAVLVKYLGIHSDDIGNLSRVSPMNYFSITVCLLYMKQKQRYNRLRSFLEAHIVAKVTAKKAYTGRDAETLMLFLDCIACPYILQSTKDALARIFGLSNIQMATLTGLSQNWFTAWEHFDLAEELDAKRSREVY